MRRFLLGSVLVVGCAQAPVEPEPTTSYVRDIQPLVERSCVTCHQAGGVAPFALDTPEAAVKMGPSLWNAIEAGRMPPFFASADCNRYVGDARLSADEKALFKTWVDERSPMGDPTTARHAEIPPPPQVRHDVVMPVGGTFDARVPGQTDVYRCFVLNPGNTTDVMVAGYEFLPGVRAIVHHMLAYAVPPENVATLDTLDAQFEGPGYDCTQGGVGVNGAIRNQVAGWVPGGAPTRLPSGTGLQLKAGGRVIMQIHYNTSGLSASAPAIDSSSLALELAGASVTRAQILPMLKYVLDIKAGDAKSVQVGELPAQLFVGPSATIYRAMGHMHQLGVGVRTELVHPDGTSECLLDITRWDFNWQRDYALVEPMRVRAGDALRITCTYDNSAANQVYVDGVQRTPRDVTWGESSFDEMCMTYMTFTK